MPQISVLIINYNSGDRLMRCLAHLEAQTFTDFEVIVVDNNSNDGSESTVEKSPLKPTLIRAGNNLGFAQGNNLGAMSATGEWLAFLNPDAYADPDWLTELIDATNRYPDVDAFGSTQIDAANPEMVDGAGDVYHAFGIPYRGHFGQPFATLPPEGEVFAPCAAAALYRRKTFDALDGFDERFFCYGEDVDLGFRLRLAGGRCIQVASAHVHHEGSGVTGRHSDFTIYYGNRNRIWTFYKNMPGVLFWSLLPFHITANLGLLIRMQINGLGKPYWRALCDGVSGLGPLRKSRQRIQKTRHASINEIARALTWSPFKMLRRAADVRPPDKNIQRVDA